MIYHTQQDVLASISDMVKDYDYCTELDNSTSYTTTYVIKKKDNIIAGCIGIKNNTIKHLRTRKKFRQCGIGYNLIKEAEKIIKNRGYLEAITFVHRDNMKAVNLFNKHNYFPVNITEHCYYLRKGLC